YDFDLLTGSRGVRRFLVGGQQPRGDERVQHFPGFRATPTTRVGRNRKHRQQIFALSNVAGPLHGHEILEQLADERLPRRTDALQGGFSVSCQRAADAADLLVGPSRQQSTLPIALLPYL